MDTDSGLVRKRLLELGLGLLIILLAIAGTRIWIELKNARRADSPVLRRSVALTITSARQYVPANGIDSVHLGRWERFLTSPVSGDVPAAPAHEFVDSFLIYYEDGVLDSVEAVALYGRLVRFWPAVD